MFNSWKHDLNFFFHEEFTIKPTIRLWAWGCISMRHCSRRLNPAFSGGVGELLQALRPGVTEVCPGCIKSDCDSFSAALSAVFEKSNSWLLSGEVMVGALSLHTGTYLQRTHLSTNTGTRRSFHLLILAEVTLLSDSCLPV